MMKQKKKKLIVSGCSYTVKNYISDSYPELDCSWPKWPELLGEKLNMEVINLGFSGAGNRYILQTLIETIERTPKDEIGLVLAAWSQSNRDDWQNYYDFNREHKFDNERYLKNFKWMNDRKNRPGSVFYWVREACLFYIILQNICKLYKLPYFQFQMLSLFEGWLSGLLKTETEIIENLNNPNFVPKYEYTGNKNKDWGKLVELLFEYEPFIDTKRFIGWPLIIKINGFAIEQKTLMKRELPGQMDMEMNEEYIIGGTDTHPNEKGHKKLAEFIYEKIKI